VRKIKNVKNVKKRDKNKKVKTFFASMANPLDYRITEATSEASS